MKFLEFVSMTINLTHITIIAASLLIFILNPTKSMTQVKIAKNVVRSNIQLHRGLIYLEIYIPNRNNDHISSNHIIYFFYSTNVTLFG